MPDQTVVVDLLPHVVKAGVGVGFYIQWRDS
ncbi:MAG: hypothetical protein BWY83_02452 [bacterium ADurb.Bin478]|nr:MAG: hypothetical protein BWY83_02452 [bacterium ADurb.Bin478]